MKILIKIASFLRKIYWFIFRPETHGVKGFLIKDNKVLLVKTSYSKWLTLPGGGIKRGETAKEAVIRELMEETGIEVLKCHLVGEYDHSNEYKNDHISLFCIDEFKEGNRTKSIEIDSVSFYPLNNLPKNVSPATKRRVVINPKEVEHGKW